MSDQGVGPEVGSLAEEAAKLLGALSGWAEDHLPDVEQVAERTSALGREAHEHLATGAPECTWCPVCRLIRSLRDTSPEVRAHLASAAGSLVQAAATFLAQSPSGEAARGTGVQHIPVDEDWPDDTAPEEAPDGTAPEEAPDDTAPEEAPDGTAPEEDRP